MNIIHIAEQYCTCMFLYCDNTNNKPELRPDIYISNIVVIWFFILAYLEGLSIYFVNSRASVCFDRRNIEKNTNY